jgi:hypothetical protein
VVLLISATLNSLITNTSVKIENNNGVYILILRILRKNFIFFSKMESLSRRRAISTMGSASTSSRKKISVSSPSTNSDSGEGTTSLAMNPSVFASGSFGKLLTQSESLSSLHSSSNSNGSPMGSGLLRVGSGFLESDDDSTSTDEDGSPGGNKRFSTMLNKLVRRKDTLKKSTTGSGSTSAKVVASHSPLPEEEMALLMPGEKTRGIHGRTKASLLVSGSTHMIPGILLVTNYRLIFIPHYSTTSPSSTSSFSASMVSSEVLFHSLFQSPFILILILISISIFFFLLLFSSRLVLLLLPLLTQFSQGDLHKSHASTPAFLLSIPHRVVDFAIPLSLLEEGGLEELTRSSHRLSRRITGDPLWLEESPRNPNATKRIRSPSIPNTSQGTFLILSCCDVQKFKFAVPNDTDVTTLSETINLHTDSIRSGYRSAFEFCRSWIANESFNRTLWQPYSPDEELKRFNQTAGVSISGFTRSWVLVDNSQNVICSRYPPRILVPFTISQDLLQSVPSEYSDNMFPIPIFSHSAKQCVLWRAGSFLDAFTPSLQSYLKILSSCSTPHSVNNLPLGKLALVVVVLGDRQNFQSLLLVEPPPKTKIEYLDVPLLYPDVGSAFNALKILCLKDIFHSPNQKMKNISPAFFNAPNSADTPKLTEWLEEIASSEWVKCVARVIAAAGRISYMMAEDGCGVLVQSGLSSVVSILSQLLTDGEFRTIRGFARLLEKDWPAEFDPPIDTEDIFISPLENAMPVSKKTPLMLILLLDCVHQVTCTFSLHLLHLP